MLINTLLLVLQELLPVCMFLSLTQLNKSLLPVPRSQFFGATILSVLVSLAVIQVVDLISISLDGNGLEILFFSMAIIQSLIFLIVITTVTGLTVRQRTGLYTGIWLLLSVSALINIFIYFILNSFPEQALLALTMGSLIGLGISVSLAIMLYFLLQIIVRRIPVVSWIFIGVFLAGQLANNTNLLAQIGWVDSQILWSTDANLPDHSVTAHILKGIIGYEATPIETQFLTYSIYLVIVLLLLYWQHRSLLRPEWS